VSRGRLTDPTTPRSYEITVASSTVSRPDTQGFGRLAAALASTADAGTRLESRLVLLTVATRWLTIGAGIILGILKPPPGGHFLAASIALVVYAAIETVLQLRFTSYSRLQVIVGIELIVAVTAITFTGGIKSPFILTPITGLLLAGYVWGRRATVGTAVAGAIAAVSAIAIETVDTSDTRSAGQIAVVFLLCGALGAFTRNLVAEMETQRAAAIDQATQMATANDLLVSLHRLAQTLPASFDLGEVVESIRRSRTSAASSARSRPWLRA
jgi:hypothetical protein